MRPVLIIEGSGNLWGSERALLDLLKQMPHRDVAVCCPPNVPLIDELEKLNIPLVSNYVYGLHEKSRWLRLWAAIGVLRACLKTRSKAIYLNQSGSYRVALPAATLLNLPMIAHIRIFEDAEYLARQAPSSRRVRALIAISAAVEAEIRRHPELAQIPLHRIYDGYEPSKDSDPQCAPERDRDRIACIGRLVPIKGQDVLVRALGLLEPRDRPVECLIVGTGQLSFIKELEHLTPTNGGAVNIRWMGFVRDIVPLLRTCAVLVCPSHREPLGRVVFEAWDAGAVPVVFAGSGGAAEIVAAAEAGIIYAEQRPESLSLAIREAMQLGEQERSRLVTNGREWMKRNCDPEIYGRAVSTILSDVSEGTRH